MMRQPYIHYSEQKDTTPEAAHRQHVAVVDRIAEMLKCVLTYQTCVAGFASGGASFGAFRPGSEGSARVTSVVDTTRISVSTANIISNTAIHEPLNDTDKMAK